MKIPSVIAGIVLTFLTVCLLSVAWRLVAPDVLPSPLEDHWIAGIVIWLISILSGIWYYRRRSRQERNKHPDRL